MIVIRIHDDQLANKTKHNDIYWLRICFIDDFKRTRIVTVNHDIMASSRMKNCLRDIESFQRDEQYSNKTIDEHPIPS